MASLVGEQLKDTYDSLLKTSDNDALGGTYKEITDGAGNGSGLYLGTGGRVGIGVSPSSKLDINIGTNARGLFADNIGEVGSGNFALQVINSSGSALKPLGFRAEDIRFATGSSERMRIDSSGFVGIGTVPATPLHVNATNANACIINVTGTSPNYIFDIRDDNVSQFRVDNAGNVGIGTTSPDASLHVESSDSTVAHFIRPSSGPSVRIGSSTTDNAVIGYTVSGDFARFGHDSATNAIVVNSSGNVGIGTTSPSEKLQIVDSANDVHVRIGSGNAGINPTLRFHGKNTADTTNVYADIRVNPDNQTLGFSGTGTSGGSIEQDALVIDSSGTVLVGKTTADNTTAGVTMYGSIAPGSVSMVRDSGNVLILNRLTDSGDVLVFRHDSVGFGQVAEVAGLLCIGSSNNVALTFTSSAIRPSNNNGSGRDNAIDLGQSGNRFQDIYATNGTIQTSDVNEKQDIEELDDAELRVAQKAKTLLRKFRWKSSVEEKGDDARVHFGIIAQDLEQAFTDEGLDAGRYAMFIKSTWTNEDGEEQTRLGVRYNQLLAFIISAI